MALVDMVMSVRGVPTTAAAVGATDTPLSSTTGKQGKYNLILHMISFRLILLDMLLPSELAWAVSVTPAGLSSSEVEDEEEEVTREWESLFLFRAEPVQLSKYLQNAKN